MILRTFWVWHKSEEGPDCELAWGQWAVDNHPDRWEELKAEVLLSYGSSVDSYREIEVQLSDEAVMKHWWPDSIEGTVSA